MTQRYVKTDYEGCSYITAGKAYEISECNIIIDDHGHTFHATDDIARFGHGVIDDWQWCDKDGNTLEGER